MFQGQSLGLKNDVRFLETIRSGKSETNLWNTEIGEQEASGTGRSPDEEHLDPETGVTGARVNKVGSSVIDNEVPEPVGSGREGHALGTDIEREDFTGNYPGYGTPSGGEEGDVNADESDQHFLSSGVRSRNCYTNDGDQEFANAHAGSADQE